MTRDRRCGGNTVTAIALTVDCGTLYRQVCAFPNHVQSIEFTTGGLQSSCRNISRMINGNRMHLRSISSLIANGLYTYVNKVFLFFLFFIHLQTFLKTCFFFVIIDDKDMLSMWWKHGNDLNEANPWQYFKCHRWLGLLTNAYKSQASYSGR